MLEIVRALKALHKTGCGTFITGREGEKSRMSWELEPEEIYAFATGGGAALVELEVAALPDHIPARPVGRGRGQRARARGGAATPRFPNLDACLASFASTKPWPAPVEAAAQAGLWEDDVAPSEWQARLDGLARAVDGVRRAGSAAPTRGRRAR
jgi:hypothetical protein